MSKQNNLSDVCTELYADDLLVTKFYGLNERDFVNILKQDFLVGSRTKEEQLILSPIVEERYANYMRKLESEESFNENSAIYHFAGRRSKHYRELRRELENKLDEEHK